MGHGQRLLLVDLVQQRREDAPCLDQLRSGHEERLEACVCSAHLGMHTCIQALFVSAAELVEACVCACVCSCFMCMFMFHVHVVHVHVHVHVLT